MQPDMQRMLVPEVALLVPGRTAAWPVYGGKSAESGAMHLRARLCLMSVPLDALRRDMADMLPLTNIVWCVMRTSS